MGEEYRVSSSMKVEQLEAELSRQLSALRELIGKGGLGQRTQDSGSYSSILPPKDESFFRAERELVLRRGLQVAAALPVQSQADVMRRELESCLGLEHTAESLPLVLHQFFSDRSSHLAQTKYLLMLRWRRFCRHAGAIQELHPHYRDQLSFLTSEYEDAVLRARRLSASREASASGRGDPADLLRQEDLLIYLRWLVCHLHSVHVVGDFLRVLHYIPACEGEEQEGGGEEEEEQTEETLRKYQQFPGAAEPLPVHTAHLGDFLPELQALLAHFHLADHTRELCSVADEMDLYGAVWREFQATFRQQEQMKTFPWYGGTEVELSQRGRRSRGAVLKKEASWIPFIRVKPRRDPWQQKLAVHLQEKQPMDELLKMHSRFLQDPDLHRVSAVMKERAASAADPQSSPAADAAPCGTSEIWRRVYGAAPLSETRGGSSGRSLKSPTSSTTNESYSFEESLKLLGLEDGFKGGASDPVVTRGAYLSLTHLRHLKLRQLQRICLGLLNYLRSVERTLTFDLAGLQREDGELRSTAEETCWMNAARGGSGEAAGLGSLQFSHNTPVDCKVRCSEFMEFPEVENLQDFYSTDGRLVHTQDQRGLYVVYDAALEDLERLESELLLVGSHFIQRSRMEAVGAEQGRATSEGGRTDVDHVAVLLDLWTCEAEFLESKVELLNCYYEAYQHTVGAEQRFALAQVITDITHSRPQLDLCLDYFVQAYRAETCCLRRHQQLLTGILDKQIENQRVYLHRIWREGGRGSVQDYGLPTNYAPLHLVSLGGSSPALTSVFLLEVHPSLCLASAVYQGVVQAHAQLCQLHRATGAAHKVLLRQKLLQEALWCWSELAPPRASYSPQTQKDLFSDLFFEDPRLVEQVGLSLARSAEEGDLTGGREKRKFAVETFSKLLELVTLRHRLLESASETAHLAQLYRNVASELGFDISHLYLRPVPFEAANQRSVFVTAALEDGSSVDRFSPTHLPLSIQDLDQNQIGRFSFSCAEAVSQLMNHQSIKNLQTVLASQVAQKNALVSAVKLACVCRRAESQTSAAETDAALHSNKDVKSDPTEEEDDGSELQETSDSVRPAATAKERLMEAFVSIQLGKVSLRDEMLSSFVKKSQAARGGVTAAEEAAAVKQGLIIDFVRKFNTQMSLHCVRAQIVAYYYSLNFLLDDFPSVRRCHFVIGRARVGNVLDPEADLCPGSRNSQQQQQLQEEEEEQQLLSADGTTLLNLWLIPHFSQVLHMFQTLSVSDGAAALRRVLLIASALHDIVHYLVSFSRLGNSEASGSSRRPKGAPGPLSADWGGGEGIGAELQELKHQIQLLSDPGSPDRVGRLLQLRRQVLLLQFDTAVRHLGSEVFLSSGDVQSQQSLSDNMAAGLPLLGDCIRPDVFSLALPVPGPLETRGRLAQQLFPWRSFLASQGWLPLRVWDVPDIQHSMQLCLSGLGHRGRLQANAAVLGASLLMEDVLSGGGEAVPVRLRSSKADLRQDGEPEEVELQPEAEAETTCAGGSSPLPPDPPPPPPPSPPLHNPVKVQSVLRGFLLLMKQLQVFKESWAQRRLGAEVCRTPSSYQQLAKYYRTEIFYPSMRALAQRMGTQRDYEVLISGSQSLQPPPGALEVDVKTFQLRRLLEDAECDMIRAVQRRVGGELTLVTSEHARQEMGLPTELWRKASLKYTLAPERPQVVETFIQELMEGAEESGGQLRVARSRLQQCLSQLGCSVMERERRSFLFYSHFYEQILQQQTQLLRQREQDLRNLKEAQTSDSQAEVAGLCGGMMLQISELRAQVARSEQEQKTLEERLSLKFRARYDPLVRHLYCTCIQLKAQLEESQWQVEQDVSEMVNRARGDAVDRIMKLKKRYSCAKDNQQLAVTLSEKEEVHELGLENSRLGSLLCKLKAASRWKQLVEQGKLHRQLLQAQQREITCRIEALRVKMTSEEEVVLLREQLEAASKELGRSRAECRGTKKLLCRKTEELQASRHQSAQEARSRRELDSFRAESLERMRADVEERERRLRTLSEQLDRDGRMKELQRQRSSKHIRQVRSQLQQELSLKQEAFVQVERLQGRLSDMEEALSRSTSTTTGQSRSYHTLSVSRLSSRSPSAGLLQSSLQLGKLTHSTVITPKRVEMGRSRSTTRMDRPKADPTRLRVLNADRKLPDL